jgi:hypothetical protein
MELEGSLEQRSDDAFVLTVDGEGRWLLELPEPFRAECERILKRRPTARVVVSGAVKARAGDGPNPTLSLSRLVQVRVMDFLVPGFKVTRCVAAPAKNCLEVGDVIREVEKEEIYSDIRLSEILQKNKGKDITIVVDRRGKSETVRVTLNADATKRPLGIDGETIWRREQAVAPTTPETIPAPPKEKRVLPPPIPPKEKREPPR